MNIVYRISRWWGVIRCACYCGYNHGWNKTVDALVKEGK